MGQRTSIEWTEVTWNPTTGCTMASEGCDNCYADVLSRRLLFHCDIPVDFLRGVFEVMLDVDRHTYQVLTKRPGRAARFVRQNGDLFGDRGLPPHIWIGTSTENQKTAYRIRHLKEVPAAVRFLSCEPLIGPLSLCKVLRSGGIHWVIVGGESGAGRRPMEARWVEDLRDEMPGWSDSVRRPLRPQFMN